MVMGKVSQMIEIDNTELRAALQASLAVDRWVDDVLRAAPFDSPAHLLAVAAQAATPLSESEIEGAIAHHPRIGEQPVGAGAAQEFSRNEQAGLGVARWDEALTESLLAGNRAYEQRFGRIFIIRAAGRTPAAILEQLEHRLTLSNSSEREIVGEQLREIALLRIEKFLAVEFA